MGARGPVPKPTATRRRTNKPVIPVKKAPRAPKATKAVKATRVTKVAKTKTPVSSIPKADPKWHPIALGWFESLAASGQSAFYEPSDWALAVLIAESISRDLLPQVVGITLSGEIVTSTIPLKGASLAAYRGAMSVLLVTEGDRRRLSVELQKGVQVDPDGDRASATVTDIRSRLSG